jgi:two-component system response regulator ChvI
MPTIIVVNDEPRMRATVRRLLEAQGHRVCTFAHGPDALMALGEMDADLVITDASNHPMSGQEFLHRVHRLTGVPVIFLSAWAEDLEEQLRGTELAAEGYIQLPFATDQLLQAVTRVLAHPRGRT